MWAGPPLRPLRCVSPDSLGGVTERGSPVGTLGGRAAHTVGSLGRVLGLLTRNSEKAAGSGRGGAHPAVLEQRLSLSHVEL